jgi:TonB-dependent SusC/RagA subfamily outer membrane receptor
MNKKILSHPWSRKLFKISILAVLLQINILGITLVYSATGQNVLETSISLKSENLHFKELLNQIEKQANVKFIYSSSIINTKQKLSFAVSNNKLETVLKDLLAPRNISYTVSGNRIMLKVVKSEENKYSEGVLQDRNITGKVTDKNGDPLPGVTVIVKNTQRGNITDTNGDFSISVPDTETSILVFSFVGFATKEVEIGIQTSINVSLDIDEKSLEEVVVVGYGSVKRKDLTGSVAQISPDAYKSQPVQDVSEMLRGNAPGVLVKTNGDGSTKIRIRGSNSLNGNNDPLYIVDGVPMGSYSPNDVESIEILKDASATAIYGSRGANGVVIITTKRG